MKAATGAASFFDISEDGTRAVSMVEKFNDKRLSLCIKVYVTLTDILNIAPAFANEEIKLFLASLTFLDHVTLLTTQQVIR